MTNSDQPYTVGSQPGVLAVHAWPLFPQSPIPASYKSAGGLFGGKAAEMESAIQRNPASVAIEAEQFVLSDDLSVEGGVSVSEQQSGGRCNGDLLPIQYQWRFLAGPFGSGSHSL